MSKLLPVYTAPDLFSHLRIDENLSELRTVAGLDGNIFDVLMRDVIYRFAELVQLAPASENHHHAGPGGLLIHTLDVVTKAIKKRRGYKLPLGGSLDDIGKQQHLWTYAIFVGCILHDIGKLSATIRLVPQLKNGSERSWTPSSGPLTELPDVKGYRIIFNKTPYRYHEHLALIHWDLLPKAARTWIIDADNIMRELTAWLWGDKYECGVIGEIIEYADRESTAQNLQVPVDHRFSNTIPVIDRYLKLIRQWLENKSIKVNVSGGMGWVDTDGHIYLVCRSLAEKLIQECNQVGLKNLPQDPVRVYDILQEHGYAIPTPNGKAIWTIAIKTTAYSHQLTCLKFDVKKLIPSSRALTALDGEITIGESTDSDTETVQQQATAFISQDSKNGGEEENVLASKEPMGTQDSNDIKESQVDIEDLTSDSKTTPQESVEVISAETSKQESGALAENVAIIHNLSLEAQDTGQKFLQWLQRGLLEKTILINNTTAEVHIVKEGVFLLAPAIFKTFLRLHGLPEDKHRNLSKRFQSLKLNIKHQDVNIHPYWVKSSNRASKINGWLLPFNVIYENDFPTPKPNKFIRKTLEDFNDAT